MMVVDMRKPKLEPIPKSSVPQLAPLPLNWTSHIDQTNGMTYYYHVPTGTTQWEFPTPKVKSPMQKSSSLSSSSSTSKKPYENQTDSLYSENVQSNNIQNSQPKQQQPVLNKDYIALSKEYKEQRKYRDKSGSQPCLLCFRAPSSHIFFPCGHKCICQDCMAINNICESHSANLGDGQDKWCFCPLCNGEIKKMSLYQTGNEEEDYWNWVNEIKPKLPHGFQHKIEKSKYYLNEGQINFSDKLNISLESALNKHGDKPKKRTSSRRRSSSSSKTVSSKACIIS
jgi:hypothetical protein